VISKKRSALQEIHKGIRRERCIPRYPAIRYAKEEATPRVIHGEREVSGIDRACTKNIQKKGKGEKNSARHPVQRKRPYGLKSLSQQKGRNSAQRSPLKTVMGALFKESEEA